MRSNLLKNISALDVPLPQKLELLREVALIASGTSQIRAWGERHLGLQSDSLDEWVIRAWWGLAAGEVLREHLYDERGRSAALELIDPADLSAIHEAQQHGGVILVTAHIGPPKAAMNYLLDHSLPLAVWTNTQDMPGWLSPKFGAKFLNPLFAEERAVLLVKSALHLRTGGVLFGAADWPSGTHTISLHRLGVDWEFSLGIPTLAHRLRLPTFLVIALWHGERIQLITTPIQAPDFAMTADEWNQLWLERYWDSMEMIIKSSPENLRFLRGVNGGDLLRELNL